MNLAFDVVAAAARDGNAIALRCGDDTCSYRALDAASARLAGVLRARGTRPGDRIGVMLPDVPAFAIACYGILRAGAVVVPMDVRWDRHEVAREVDEAGARLVLAWHGCAEEAEAGAGAAGAGCLFVAPGEFDRLLAGACPVRDPVPRGDTDTAVVTARGIELTHGRVGRAAAEGITLSEPVTAMHAAILKGAATVSA